MRTFERTIILDALAIAAAAAIIGVSFGVIAVGRGVSFAQTQVMSLAVFAGGSQFVLIGGVGSGLAAAVIAGLLLNARHIAFGVSLSPIIGGSLLRRTLASHVVVDESTAYALGQPDLRRQRQGFVAVGLLLFVAWNAGTAVGAVAGEAIDYKALGVDAAFPALLLAMLAPMLNRRATRAAALAGATIAVLSTPLTPRGVPMILAGLGALAGSLVVSREEVA
jgi:4-azaleucine resistance transporter AzlC